eukprot:ANDGO_06410.mRNA.1 Serine/threonine-protein kinase ssn3
MSPKSGQAAFVFDYAEYDLQMLLEQAKDAKYLLPFRVIRCIMWQMLQGLRYLHGPSVRILHRDIKPSNILVCDGKVQIADFGLARQAKPAAFHSRAHLLCPSAVDYSSDPEVVSLWYRAPELLLGSSSYGPAIDIWSAGCIMYELITTHVMFPGRQSRQVSSKLPAKPPVLANGNAANGPGVPVSSSSSSVPPSSSTASSSLLTGKRDHPESSSTDRTIEISQILQIFALLGKACEQAWPTASQTVHWQQLQSYAERSVDFQKFFLNVDVERQRRQISQKVLQYRPGERSGQRVSADLTLAIDLLLSMLQYDPAKRVSAADALNHPFFSADPASASCGNVFSLLSASHPFRPRQDGNRTPMTPQQSHKHHK